MNYKLLTSVLAGLLIFASQAAFGQNIGINTTGTAPNTSALLDLNTGNTFTSPNGKGILIPNVSLTGATDNTTVAVGAAQNSMLVYNTSTAGAGSTAVNPGYYYWNNSITKWVPLLDGTPPNAGWMTTGNYGTTAGTNYLGTNDANDVVFKANSTEAMRIAQSSGYVGIGTTIPTAKLDVSGITGSHAIYGHTPNTGGYLGYETSFTFGTTPQTISGAGVWAANPLANYTSFFAQSSGTANVAAAITYSNVWIASYNYVDNASNAYNPDAIYGQLNPTATTLAAFESAITGYNNRAGTGGNPGYSIGVTGVSNSQNQDAFGIEGDAYSNSGYSAGAYFDGNNYAGTNYAFAYVAGDIGGIIRKIAGSGSVSEIISTPAHGRIVLTCPESPEYWYQDYGTVQLVNGKAHVTIDPILADVIFVNDSNPIRVFCTSVNMPNFNGVTIMNQSSTGFDIVELNGGTHSGKVDYQIVAKPKTNFGEGRFPQAPGPAGAPKDLPLAKAKNQIDPSKIWHWLSDPEVYHYTLLKKQPTEAKKVVAEQSK